MKMSGEVCTLHRTGREAEPFENRLKVSITGFHLGDLTLNMNNHSQYVTRTRPDEETPDLWREMRTNRSDPAVRVSVLVAGACICEVRVSADEPRFFPRDHLKPRSIRFWSLIHEIDEASALERHPPTRLGAVHGMDTTPITLLGTVVGSKTVVKESTTTVANRDECKEERCSKRRRRVLDFAGQECARRMAYSTNAGHLDWIIGASKMAQVFSSDLLLTMSMNSGIVIEQWVLVVEWDLCVLVNCRSGNEQEINHRYTAHETRTRREPHLLPGRCEWEKGENWPACFQQSTE